MDLFLVKPNLGNPLILQPKDIIEGFRLVFAGKTDETPSSREVFLKLTNSIQLKKIDGTADFGLRVLEVSTKCTIYSRPKTSWPITARDHKYKAGFRWEYEVKVKVTVPSDAIREPQGWPQIFDIYFYEKHTHSKKTNYHAIYVDERLPTSDKFTLIHITDLHVAIRNDRIPEILSEVRDKIEHRKLLAKYNNFNNNLRAVIKYANEKLGKDHSVVLVATGDLTDYYHDGFFKKGNKSTSNFAKLVEILTNRDGKGEPLKCPIFTILGNHDYLLYEPPLRIDIELLNLIKVHEKDSNKAFGLSKKEGREYDYWMRGCPGFPHGMRGIPKELWSTTPEIERRRYIKGHGGWDFDLDSNQSYSLGKPRYNHLVCYLEMINYDTDFEFSIGPHQFVCLNTGQDIYPSKGEFFQDTLFGGLSDSKRDYIENGPHNRGIRDEHLTMLGKALKTRQPNGLVFSFTHAPLLSLPKDRTKGIEILFEDSHSKPSTPPNDVTIWLGKYMSLSWMNQFWAQELSRDLGDFHCAGPFHNMFSQIKPRHPCLQPEAIESNKWCKEQAYYFFRRKGYPQTNTAFFKHGKRDIFLNFSCADGKVQKFFQLIAPSGNVLRQLNVSFSGHTHKVHEFRIQAQRGSDKFYYFIDDYSGSSRYTSESLRSSSNPQNRKMWLNNHQPLLVTSGGLKKKYPEFREVIVEGNNIKSMKMKHLPRLGDSIAGMEYFYTAASVEVAKRSRTITSSNVYSYVNGAKARNSRGREMLNLMERCHRLFSTYRTHPSLPTIYAEITLWLNSFGVDFGSPTRNSMSFGMYYSLAKSSHLNKIEYETNNRIIDISNFAHPDEGGNHLLCMWYTHESLHLAKLGGYTNSVRNNPTPSVHMDWSLNLHWGKVIDDLEEKYRLQFDRLYNKRDKGEFLDFCSDSSARLATWGVGYTSKPSIDPAYYRNRYLTLINKGDVEGVWKQLKHHIMLVASALLTGGSGY
jgi:hypothetical protein